MAPTFHRHDERLIVGRERERALLRDLLDDAVAGHGSLVLISGEAGIGKTRMAEEIVTEVSREGIETFWGRCHEWEGAPAFWPWLQILRRYVERTDEDAIRSDLADIAEDLAQIMPDLERFSKTETSTYTPEERRFRLFDAMARLLRTVTKRQPVVLVLDDLHWADRPSLRLLEFLVQDVHELPLLLIATYRTVEIDGNHPLTGTLAEVSRSPASRRLSLHGLHRDAVSRYIELMSGREPSLEMVEAVVERTDGNPFFMTEVVDWLQSERQLDDQNTAGGWTIQIPESVRDAVSSRFDRLSAETNEILSIAAVIGREFRLQLLARAREIEPLKLLDQLDEAVQAGLIEESKEPGEYRFSHVLIQEARYNELAANRQVRLHATVATALEELYANDLTPHYAALAYHFSRSALVGNVDRAVEYATRAGDQSMERLAWESATDHYLTALQLFEDVKDDARLPILFALSQANLVLGEFENSKKLALEGIELSRLVERPDGIIRGAQLYTRGDYGPWTTSWTTSDSMAVELLQEALTLADVDDHRLQIDLRARLVEHLPASQTSHQMRRKLADEALAIARQSSSDEDLVSAYFARYFAYFDDPDKFSDKAFRDRSAIIRALLDLQPQGSEARAVRVMSWASIYERLLTGAISIPDLYVFLDSKKSDAHATRAPYYIAMVELFRMMAQVMEGQFAAAIDLVQSLFDDDGNIDVIEEAWPGQYLFLIHREQNTLEEYIDEIRRFVREDHDFELYWQIRLTLALLEIGKQDEAGMHFAEIARGDLSQIIHDRSWLENIATFGEIAHLLDDRERAASITEILEPYAHLNASAWCAADFMGSVAYYLGLLATTLERWEDAEEHFQFALERHEVMQLPPYIANTQHKYAEMLVRRGSGNDLDQARELNERALAAAREMGMVRLERLTTTLADDIGARDSASAASIPYGLTQRELEVLACLIEGQTDREIGQALFISHHTVMRHVANILGKLGVSSRTAAAATAVRENLI